MTDLIHSQPDLSIEDALKIVKDFFGREGKLQKLDSERDQNFLLHTADRQKYVLKIANSQTDSGLIDLENQAMFRIRDSDDQSLCPVPLESINGNSVEKIDQKHSVRLVSFIEGQLLANAHPQSPALLHDLGQKLGRITRSLQQFDHASAKREFHWDLDKFAATFEKHKLPVSDFPRLDRIFENYSTRTLPLLDQLRKSIIHNDANDHNVVVSTKGTWPQKVVGIIDFGDMVFTSSINELAIATAYVMLGKSDPLLAASHVVKGFNESLPLTDVEFHVLYDLILARLSTSVLMAAYQRSLNPDNEYLSVTDQPARELLSKIESIHSEFAEAYFRSKCGVTPLPNASTIALWIENDAECHPILAQPCSDENIHVLDLSVSSNDPIAGDLGAESPELVFQAIKQNDKQVGIGRYLEPRMCYQGEQFSETDDPEDEPRTIHMGVDLFVPADTPIYAPLDGVVHSFADNNIPFDYGPTIILEHTTKENIKFFTLYGHLSRKSLDGLEAGQAIPKGQKFATIGSRGINGGWAPHLHFQVMSTDLGLRGNFPGVVKANDLDLWRQIILDPCKLSGLPQPKAIASSQKATELAVRRTKHLNPSLSLSYQQPLHIVRGSKQYLYDAEGLRYLDCVNNVCHVGHCHPHVTTSASKQLTVLNTNTRYLHDAIVRFAERLVGTLPEGLDVCYFVNSGSEANDLALRLARNYTKRNETICVDGAYHGNLSTLIDISPYKFNSAGGQGQPKHVHMVPMPDPLRGPHIEQKIAQNEIADFYSSFIDASVKDSSEQNDESHQIASFICESILSCGGQIVLPKGYLQSIYKTLKQHNILSIADEVQVGFGRVGKKFWAFELQEVVPDIVTMGKPIGNGFPLGAVVTSREIAEAFNNGMEYFNTFGGNPVSCQVGNAVLDVIEQEQLQRNAELVGKYFLNRLNELKSRYGFVADVRGEGLFIGIEFVDSADSAKPNPALANYIVERMKNMRVLLSTDGPHHNVIKIKPPLVFDESNVDFVISCLYRIFEEDLPTSFA